LQERKSQACAHASHKIEGEKKKPKEVSVSGQVQQQEKG